MSSTPLPSPPPAANPDPSADPPAAPDPDPNEPVNDPVPVGLLCGNCDAELRGPFCHMCGQSVRSPIRDLFEVVSDGIGEFFHLDGRFFRSLLPLYFKPGWLTMRYLAGQRVSFILPLRMYLVISIAMFLVLSFETAIDPDGSNGEKGVQVLQFDNTEPGLVLTTPGGQDPLLPAVPRPPLPTVPGATLPTVPPQAGIKFNVAGKPWDAKTNPFIITWLPASANARANLELAKVNEKIAIIKKEPDKLADEFFGILPTTMFVMLPLFAAILKILYLFKRRFYAEHLLVALHSHSFMFLNFLLMFAVLETQKLAGGWVASVGSWLLAAMWLWIPIYLFKMQKRVYRQSRFMTMLKYISCAFAYITLLSIGFLIAFGISVVSI